MRIAMKASTRLDMDRQMRCESCKCQRQKQICLLSVMSSNLRRVSKLNQQINVNLRSIFSTAPRAKKASPTRSDWNWNSSTVCVCFFLLCFLQFIVLNFAAEILKYCSIIYRARFLSRLVALLHQLREVSTGKGSARKEVKVAQIDMGNGCMQFGSENILNFAFLVYFGSS